MDISQAFFFYFFFFSMLSVLCEKQNTQQSHDCQALDSE